MADDVKVVFGAEIAGLIAGIRAAREQIESLKAPVFGIISSLSGVAEAIGAAFAVEKLVEFTHDMAELGETTLNASFILGQSVAEYAKLAGAIELAGGDAEAAQRTLERLGKAVASALKEPVGAAATSFHNLGISQQEVAARSTNLTELLSLIIERFNTLKPGLQNVGELYAILGRGIDRLAPLLRHNKEGFDELLHAAEGYSQALATTANSSDKTAEAQHKLGLDLKTLGVDAFGLISDAVKAFTRSLDAVVNAVDWVVKKIGELKKAAEEAAYSIQNFLYQMIRGPGTALLPPVDVAAKAPPGTRELGTEKPGGRKAGAGGDTRLAEWKDQLRAQLEAEGNFFDDSKAEELKFWQEKLTLVSGGGTKDLAVRRSVNAEIFNLEKELAKQTETNAIEEQTYKARVAEEVYSGKKAHLDAEVALGKVTAAQGVTQEKELLDQKWALDQEYFEKKLDAANKDANESKKLEEQEFIDYQKYLNQKQSLDDKAAEASKKSWEAAVAPIERALDTSIAGVIQGTTTLSAAFGNMVQSILLEIVSANVKGAFNNLLRDSFTNVLGEGGGFLGKLFGGTLLSGAGSVGSEAPIVAAGTTFATETTAAGTAFATEVTAAGTAFAAATSAGGAAGAAGGLGGSLLSWLPGIPFLLKGGGIIPSAAGGWTVPSFQGGGVVGILHPREMVLPADLSAGLQQLIAGGGPGDTHMHLHGPVDLGWFKDQMIKNAPAIGQMFRQSALTPRSLSRAF